jgi:hypothetical protein
MGFFQRLRTAACVRQAIMDAKRRPDAASNFKQN